ncbi:MAG: energy transducer TonB [Ginsengibacter sp.]
MVKIKFVVDYDGKPESFEVVKSGGTAFDSEVLMVLRKTHMWNPGKSKRKIDTNFHVVAGGVYK